VNKHGREWAVTTADHVRAPPVTIDGPAACAREATPLEVFETFMLECRQLVRRKDSIAVLHISLNFIARPGLSRGGCHYRSAVDVERAADLYAQGRTLRQIAADLGVTETTVSEHLRRAGVTMRRGAPPHPASTQQIVELRDQDQSWTEVAEKIGMTRSDAWSRYQRSRPPMPARLGRWQQVLADALDQNLAIGVRAAVADHLGRAPNRAELTAARRDAHGLAALGRARVFHVPGADADANTGDSTY
jgi:hypothetical protein